MSEGSGGDSCELALSSQEDGYRLSKDKSSKYFDVDHLCSASRVSHQFRLMRCKGEVTEMVNVKLKISQSEENQTDLILKTKVRNIILSPESLDILLESMKPNLVPYEKRKRDISHRLESIHCQKLAV
ncbi:hypothetical protein, partial [Salmonella sp. s54395]|uniref:hypothetical protein n=1 Tax=Salmonella sp. s54395 TaxID=3159664 RepID=UPI0039810908